MTLRAFDFEPLAGRLPRVGVLGAANIVPKALTAVSSGLCELSAIAARDPARARQFASQYGFADHSASYEELIRRSDVDVVYVALPAALHAPWVRKALSAGKHVLCEKPFALSARDAEECVALARSSRRMLMEAHHACYHPLLGRAAEWARLLGPLRSLSLRFDGPIPPGDIRLDPGLGAGVLLDFSCYLLKWQQAITGDARPKILLADAVEERSGVEVTASVKLRTKTGTVVRFDCDMRPEATFRASLVVEGSRGSLHFENPLVTSGSSLRLTTDKRRLVVQGTAPSTYRHQLSALARGLRRGRNPLTAGRSIIETQEMLDALVAACGLPPKGTARCAPHP